MLQHLSVEPFGLSRHPHPLAVVQSNTFILLFLMLHKDSHLFSEIVNGFVEFFIDATGQASGEYNPHFLFHSPDTLRNPPSTGNHFHPRRPYVTVVEGVMWG